MNRMASDEGEADALVVLLAEVIPRPDVRPLMRDPNLAAYDHPLGAVYFPPTVPGSETP